MSPVPIKCSVPLAAILPHLKAQNLVRSASEKAFNKLTGTADYCVDSRKLKSGDIFIAYKGVSSDGHAHLAKAWQAGARLLIIENKNLLPPSTDSSTVAYIEVTSGRAAWTCLAALAHSQPEESLTFMGVTGTNGKTSTVWMVAGLLRAAGVPCLSIGTLGASFGEDFIPTGHTTPDPDLLFALLAHAKAQGIRHVVMEVSSHAIAQDKLLPLRFTATAFTSFSRDHLDFHTSLEDYFATKWRLFKDFSTADCRHVFWDGLDQNINLQDLPGETIVYGQQPVAKQKQWGADAACTLSMERSDFTGTLLQLAVEGLQDGLTCHGFIPYFAKHALENFAAAFLISSKIMGRAPQPQELMALAPVPGRLEQVISSIAETNSHKPMVIVDYAHTPDALEKTLLVLRPLCQGQLVVVFGCGGDRDKGKRPQMGRIAEQLADSVYITSDNPRSEDPQQIITDICAGMMSIGKEKTQNIVCEVDRAEAIKRAICAAEPRDTILIAGKGHETYQIIQGQTLNFDDRAVARQILDQLK